MTRIFDRLLCAAFFASKKGSYAFCINRFQKYVAACFSVFLFLQAAKSLFCFVKFAISDPFGSIPGPGLKKGVIKYFASDVKLIGVTLPEGLVLGTMSPDPAT